MATLFLLLSVSLTNVVVAGFIWLLLQLVGREVHYFEIWLMCEFATVLLMLVMLFFLPPADVE